MKILGLTGDIACGKSTVGRYLAGLGAAHLDADELVRELYARPDFSRRIAQTFGDGVLNAAGTVDSGRLRALVWQQAQGNVYLKRLESLVFPAVAALRGEKLGILRAQNFGVAVVEAVKLLESGQGAGCDEIWCVTASTKVQMQRLMENRGLDESAARARLKSQPSRAQKAQLAGAVPLLWMDNNGSRAELEARVAREWTRFDGK